MMNGKIHQLILVVKNQSDALKFYTEQVGFEKKTDYKPPESHRWVTVGPKGQDIEIALYEEGTPDANNWSKNWKAGKSTPISIRVDDCLAEFEKLKSRGVKFFEDKPHDASWGTNAAFADPDGNLFSLNQPPKSPDWK